jgi:hypothetical protein
LTRLRRPIAACLALLAQLLAQPVHRMAVATNVAAELRVVLGDSAALCIQIEDGKSAPAPARDDSCPLCQLSCGACALQSTVEGLRMRIDPAAEPPGFALVYFALKPSPTSFAQPRAPPPEA